ncbi:MAG: hypothetical protein C4541_10380 [Candidatus Auribacter fodinae]|jgi:hypothetical protein|uniref:Uncharacterized protein n=1 Tax=Candidatus Auribacter fodinae TaxID=2093366 RepID=A0A3A4R506_9BACT|nr:MAG: hypothetical protein C4541_10380 [Candidatus Auribacter fodinae]
MSDKLESYIQQLEDLIQKKLLDSEEFHEICHKMKDEEYHVDMGVLALLMDHDKEKGFVSFPFYLEFSEKKENSGNGDEQNLNLSKKDVQFLKDLGISF